MGDYSIGATDRRRFLAALLGVSSGLAGCAPPAAKTTAVRHFGADGIEALRSDLTPLMREAQRRYRIPAISLVLVDDLRVLWAAGFGHADVSARVPATATTRYRGGSLAKPLTAIAVMQLAEAGRVDIDAPLVESLPGFAIRSRFAPAGGPITPRQLLCHHSGLPTDLNRGLWSDDRFTAVTAALHEDYAAFPPGLVFSYSNIGYSLLGHLIEVCTGRRFEDYMTEEVLAPLGMTETRFASWPSRGLARGYRDGAAIGLLPIRDLPAHGLETTAADMGRLLRALLGGGRLGEEAILTPPTIAEMFSVQSRDSPLDLDTFTGLSWRLEQDSIAGCGRVARQGASTPGFAAECLLLPERALGVTVLANSDGARDVAAALAELTLARAMGVLPSPAGVTAWPPLHRSVPSAPIALAGEYATDLGVLSFRPERAALCVCWLDETFRLRAPRQGWYALDEGVEFLPGVLQPLAGMRFQARRIAGREVLIAWRAGREMRFGEKVSPVPDLNPSWQARLGAYEILDADPGFPVRETQLLVQHGHLCLAYRLPRLTSARIQLPLRAVSPTEAIVLGLGRTRGETVRMVQVGGEERLRFSGWIARPVAPA